ncbi:MAG TPA: OadG family protein [bacterium]|nr:OadG family protein [bacterium]
MHSIASAHGIQITLVGMGTVFAALVLMSLFTSLFNKIFARRQTEEETGAEPPPCPPPVKTQTPAKTLEASRRKAAAIAVAVALVEMTKAQAVFQPVEAPGNAWRTDGRRRLSDRMGAA